MYIMVVANGKFEEIKRARGVPKWPKGMPFRRRVPAQRITTSLQAASLNGCVPEGRRSKLRAPPPRERVLNPSQNPFYKGVQSSSSSVGCAVFPH